MRKFYITFGQIHQHYKNGIFLDKDCVVEIEAENEDEARNWARRAFGHTYSMIYKYKPEMHYFSRGIIKLQEKLNDKPKRMRIV
jgi:alpha-L-fucosidase